jgi:hypothetical protein
MERPISIEALAAPALFEHLVCERQHSYGNVDTDGARCAEIDRKLELRGLLDREIAWVCPFEHLINVRRCSPEALGEAGAITD